VKFEFHLLFLLLAIGMLTKKSNWKSWYLVTLLVFGWIMFNWYKA
jgi:hypothetical protein